MSLHSNLLAIGVLTALALVGCLTENSQESVLACTTTKTDNVDGTVTFTESCEQVPNVCEYMNLSGQRWFAKCE